MDLSTMSPSRQPPIPGPYPVDELVECEADQAVLQEGPSPAQVQERGQTRATGAWETDAGRQMGACGAGAGGGRRGTQAPQGRGPAARRRPVSRIGAGRRPWWFHILVASPVKWSWQPAAGVGVKREWQGLGAGAHF